MDRKRLHKTEMELVYLLEEGILTTDDIINHFTGLMNETNQVPIATFTEIDISDLKRALNCLVNIEQDQRDYTELFKKLER